MKKAATLTLISAVAVMLFTGKATANPGLLRRLGWENLGVVSPRFDTVPPQVSIFSPKENTCYYNRTVELTLDVTGPTGPTVGFWGNIMTLYYKASWMDQTVFVVNTPLGHRYSSLSKFSKSLVLTEVPDGRQSVTVRARYVCDYDDAEKKEYGIFYMAGYSTVSFTVDTTPLRVSVLTPQNQTYQSVDIPLNFTVKRQTAWMGYCLDGGANTTVAPNIVTTRISSSPKNLTRFSGGLVLTGLSEGSHSLTVFAEDMAGNTGKSDLVSFSIAKETQPQNSASFPAKQLIAVATVVSAAVVGFGLLAYLVKSKRKRSEA
jgi:hypothetical protein